MQHRLGRRRAVVSAAVAVAWGLTHPFGGAGAADAVPSAAVRPFAEYEDTGYVLMAAFDAYGSEPIKREIARGLPGDVTLVLYGFSPDPGARQAALDDYGRFVPATRLIYLAFPRAPNMFWSRDALPVPLLDDTGRLQLADAKYWGGFEPDAGLAALFGVTRRAHAFQFEGGNLIANHLGNCFIVESRTTRKMSDAVFATEYGCRGLVRLPKRGGIGHVDERARFVDATTVVTDTPDYGERFRAGGLRVVALPRPSNDRQSYVNALVVNGTAFVPQFSRPEDARALEVYRELGFAVTGLDARTLVAKGKGALHCLAMTYPRAPLAAGLR